MTTPFDPITNKDFNLLETNYIQALPGGQFALKVKSLITWLPTLVAKFIHWIRNPNEHIATISEAFTQKVKENEKTILLVKEEATFYANIAYVNKRVIEKHNKTLLFWMRAVAPIDAKPMTDRIDKLLNIIESALKNIDPSQNLHSQAIVLSDCSDSLKALKILENAQDERSAKLKTLQDLFSTKLTSYQDLVKQSVDKYNAASQLEDADLEDLDHVVKAVNTYPPPSDTVGERLESIRSTLKNLQSIRKS